MAKINFSSKRIQISKANTAIVAATATAAFLVIFSLVAGKTLLNKRSYQAKIISEKKIALKQLETNEKNVDQLIASYKLFVEQPENIIGGVSTGTGDRDGDNAKIILDALPSKYDFPALATSLEKLMVERNYEISSISGTDLEVEQSANNSSNKPEPVDIPFEVIVKGNFDSFKSLMGVFEGSIRPFYINSLSVSGDKDDLSLSIKAKTYYQPSKILDITEKVVK